MEENHVPNILGGGFPSPKSSESRRKPALPTTGSTSSSDQTESEEGEDETEFDEIIDISNCQTTQATPFSYSPSKIGQSNLADIPHHLIATSSSSDVSQPWYPQEDKVSGELTSSSLDLTFTDSATNSLASAVATLSRQHQEQFERMKLLYSIFALNPEFRGHIDPFNVMDPRSHGLRSVFSIEAGDMIKLKPGGKATDTLEWTVGFDPRLFVHSVRNLNLRASVACPYKVRGRFSDYEIHCNQSSEWGRRRFASEKIEAYLNPQHYQLPVADDFELIAQAFFGGREIPENTETLKDDGTKPHITYHTSEFAQVLQEDPLEEKQLICFLQDCLMAATYENACFPKKDTVFGNLKVFRSDNYTEIKKLVAPADFENVTIELSREPLETFTSTEISAEQVIKCIIIHEESKVAEAGDVEPTVVLTKQKKRKDHRSKKNKSKLSESKGEQSQRDNSCEQNAKEQDVTEAGTNNIMSEDLKQKAVGEEHTADNSQESAPTKLQLIGKYRKGGRNVQPDVKHDDCLSRGVGKFESDTATQPDQTSSRAVDDSSGAFEPHDHLLSQYSKVADDTLWEVVKSKTSKIRGGARRGKFSNGHGSGSSTQVGEKASKILTSQLINSTHFSTPPPRGSHNLKFSGRQAPTGSRLSSNGPPPGPLRGLDHSTRGFITRCGGANANMRSNVSCSMTNLESQHPSNIKLIVPEEFPALPPKPKSFSIQHRGSQSEAGDDQAKPHKSDGGETGVFRDICSIGHQTSRDFQVEHAIEVGKSDYVDGSSGVEGTSTSTDKQIHNVANISSDLVASEATSNSSPTKSEHAFVKVVKLSRGDEVDASSKADTTESNHEPVKEQRLINVAVKEADREISLTFNESPIISDRRSEEDSYLSDFARPFSATEDKSEKALAFSIEEIDPNSEHSNELIKEDEKCSSTELFEKSVSYERLLPSLDGMMVLDINGQHENEQIESPTSSEHLISRHTTEDDDTGTPSSVVSGGQYESVEAPYFHHSAGQDQPRSNSLHTINTPGAEFDDISPFESGDDVMNLYSQQQPWNPQFPPLHPIHAPMHRLLPYQHNLSNGAPFDSPYLNEEAVSLPHMPTFPTGLSGYHGRLTPVQGYMMPNHIDASIMAPADPLASIPPPIVIDGYQRIADSHTSSTTDGSACGSYDTHPERQIMSGQRTPASSTVMTFNCSSCRKAGVGNLSAPMVLCPGCGPKCNIRYCSVACLLADAYCHSGHCMNFPACQQMRFYNLPAQFVYEKDPIVALDVYFNAPEHSRQKLFSMYRRSRAFPATSKELAKQDLNGTEKFASQHTGDYYVFRSDSAAISGRSIGAQVIFILALREEDHVKVTLQRALNACYLLPQSYLLKFLFRLIRYCILHDATYRQCHSSAPSNVVFEEFKQQFSKEFAFDVSEYENEPMEFDPDNAAFSVIPYLEDMEMNHPILRYWIGR